MLFAVAPPFMQNMVVPCAGDMDQSKGEERGELHSVICVTSITLTALIVLPPRAFT